MADNHQPSEATHPAAPETTAEQPTLPVETTEALVSPSSESPAGAAEAQAAWDAEIARRDEEIARLRSELDQAKDRALRSLAELDNYRKRANRTIEEERRYALMPLLRDLLPVLDDLRRAIDSAQSAADAAALRDGVELVARKFEGVLAKHHCKPIDALHQPFDPNYHEAVLQQPSSEFPPNTVLQVVRTGFTLHERVVRPSQVIVSTPPT